MTRTLLVISLLASACTSAYAQDEQKRSGTPAEQQACAKDVSRYCRDVMNSSDLAILGCLKANRASLSKPCEKVLQDHNQ
jgi:hypothetical protein